MGGIFRSFRFSLRSLIRDPQFTVGAVLALSLGVSAVTAGFGVIYSVLITPLPYRDAKRLTTVSEHFKSGNLDRPYFSPPEFIQLQQQNHTLEDTIGIAEVDVLYRRQDGMHLADGAWVTDNTFQFLGIQPLLGHPIFAGDSRNPLAQEFVISYRLWTQEFNQDRSILGSTFLINGSPRTLAGVMPPRFRLLDCDVWMPLTLTSTTSVIGLANRPARFQMIGRVKHGVALSTAAADLDGVAQRFESLGLENFPERFVIRCTWLVDSIVGQFRRTLTALMIGVAMLLLIACANVGTLLLVRSTKLLRETSIRVALGVQRAELFTQVLIESLLLSLVGCVIGYFIAYLALRVIVTTIPKELLPPEVTIRLDPAMFGIAVALATATTILCSLAPTMYAFGGDLQARLAATKGSRASGRKRVREALVVVQVALSVGLLIGTGLMVRTVMALEHVDLGCDPANVLVMRVPLPAGRYGAAEKLQFFRLLVERVKEIRGVVSDSETATAPPPRPATLSLLDIPGKVPREPWYVMFEMCSEDYFRTLSIPIIRGRFLSASDMTHASRVAVINQSFARKYFRDSDPLGKQIRFSSFDDLPEYPHQVNFEIVGVTADVKNRGLRNTVMPQAYIPYTITAAGSRGILVKAALEPTSVVRLIRQEVARLDSDIPSPKIDILEQLIADNSYAQPRFTLLILTALASIGTVLAFIGVFGIMTYTVSAQKHDIGIRLALGAQKAAVAGMILGKSIRLLAAGIAAGIAGSFILSHALASQIWGVSSIDIVTAVLVGLLMLPAGILACLAPAYNATRVEPQVTLRHE